MMCFSQSSFSFPCNAFVLLALQLSLTFSFETFLLFFLLVTEDEIK